MLRPSDFLSGCTIRIRIGVFEIFDDSLNKKLMNIHPRNFIKTKVELPVFFILRMMVLTKNKLSEVVSQLVSLVKYAPRYYRQRIEEITYIFEAENELAQVSNMEFVFAIRPVLRELSHMEIEPFSVVYKDYIEKVKLSILKGQELVDVLNIYDAKLLEMKGERK